MNVKIYVLKLVCILAFLMLMSCASDPGVRIDQVPMYGGIDRNADEQLTAGDRDFIQKVLAEYGDKRTASQAWVEQAFTFYHQDNFDYAMRRFNQAWLLDDTNPEVYHGFGSVMLHTDGDCASMDMLQKALHMDWQKHSVNRPGYLADLAYVTSLCVAYDDQHTLSKDRDLIWAQVDQWFNQAKNSVLAKNYVYQKWWQSLYHQRNYAAAWAKIAELRALGGSPNPGVLNLLMKQMPKPKSQANQSQTN